MSCTTLKGINWVFQVQDAGTFETLAAQRGLTLNIDAETIDTTSKDQNAWAQTCTSTRSWSIDVDALSVTEHASYQALLDGFVAADQTEFLVQIVRPDGKVWRGKAHLTTFPHEAPFDDAATYSATFTGNGEPELKFETPF